MIELSLVGIGSGNPEHLTLEAIGVLEEADLILLPRKGDEKTELADLRRDIVADILKTKPKVVTGCIFLLLVVEEVALKLRVLSMICIPVISRNGRSAQNCRSPWDSDVLIWQLEMRKYHCRVNKHF